MKRILFCLSASKADGIIRQRQWLDKSYEEILAALYGESLFMTFGYDPGCTAHHLILFNSQILQAKWATSQEMEELDPMQLLREQIRRIDPEIFYTNNPEFFTPEVFEQLPSFQLKVGWKAAPFGAEVSLAHFDLGLSYATIYLDMLKERGVRQVALKQFCFNPAWKNQFQIEKQYDLTFAGSYHWMFNQRNLLLNQIAKAFPLKTGIKFFLSSVGNLGDHPQTLLLKTKKKPPVFLMDYMEVLMQSKITFNHHSDIAGPWKGNMRVFETLGVGSFLLTDEGNYPEGLMAGRDFITYSDFADLRQKIKYYLQNDKEREQIALQGSKTISAQFSLTNSVAELDQLFSNYT